MIKRYLLAALICCTYLVAFTQNVNLQVVVTQVHRTSYNDCLACGNPDPTWKIEGTHNGNGAVTYGPVCFHIDEMASTIFDNPDYTLMNLVNTNATSFTVGLNDAFDKSCDNDNCNYKSYNFFTCFPSPNGDSRRCQAPASVFQNFRNSAPCQWHTQMSPYCGDFAFEYSYFWSFNAAPTLTTQPAANTNACIGTPVTLSVVAATANGWTTGQNYQWQVSTSTACPGTNWQNIPAATGPTFTVPEIGGTRLYRVLVTSNCTPNFTSNTTTSNCAVVTYNPIGSPGDVAPDIISGICGSSVLPGSTHTLGLVTAPDPGAALGLTGYTWTASGGSPGTSSNATFVWTAPVNPGSYSINLTYNDNCPQPDAMANTCVVNVGSATCDFAYVATYGNDSIFNGGPDNPYKTLLYALTQLNGRKYIRMATGVYNETAPLQIPNDLIIEGSYRVNGNIWTKTNADSTVIIGQGTQIINSDVAHRVAFISTGSQNWMLQDLVITTPDILTTTASNRGYSNYGVLALAGSSNFEIVRCKIYAGNAADGINGTTPPGIGGAGGGGGGGNAGSGSNTRCGGSGGNGGGGASGNGGAAGGGPGSGCGGSGCNVFNCDATGCSGSDGTDGQPGAAGSGFAAGVRPVSPATTAPYYIPAGQSFAGNNGFGGGGGGGGGGGDIGTCCTCGCGGGTPNGGSGGNGGGGGLAGPGGYGGGGSFGLYAVGAGTSGTLTTSLIVAGNAGTGGTGANGQGGASGANGNGGTNHGGCDGGVGGDGGRGGNGGAGGRGQDGANGLSLNVVTVGGATITGSSTAVPNAAIISIAYKNSKACINSEIELGKSTGVWSFPTGLDIVNDQRDLPAGVPISSYNASSNPVLVYTTTPSVDYDLTVNGFVYAKYLKLADDNRVLPAISVSSHTICQDGIDSLSATGWGTQVEYDWKIYQGTNVNSPLYQSTLPSPTINFFGFAPGLYNVRYRVRESCCGWSKPVFDTIRILAPPTPFTVSGGGNYCPGTAGALINLSGSEPGVSYVLLYNGNPVDTITGTGGPVTFNPQTGVGNYTVTASRFAGCDARMFGNVDIGLYPQPQAFTVSGNDTICAGSNATVTLSGSELGATYQLLRSGNIPVGPAIPGTGSPLTFSNISVAGIYTVISTNTTSGCRTLMDDSAQVLIAPQTSLYTVTGGGTFCLGDTGVAVGLSGSDSGTVYQLLQHGVLPQNTVVGTGSAISFGNVTTAGYYKVKAYSIFGCEGMMSDSVVVTISPAPQIVSVTTTAVSCNGNATGTITISATTQNPPLSYSIDSGNTYVSNNVFSSLAAGPYHVFVRDNSNCTTQYAVNPVVVGTPGNLTIRIEAIDSIYCTGAVNGAIRINVFGGTAPYSYNWNTGNTLEDLAHLTAGTYTVSVTDQNNCSSSLTIELPAAQNPLAVTTAPINVKCFRGNDGSVTAFVTGGQPPYRYYLNGLYQSDSSFTGLVAGDYSLIVYDANDCNVSSNFTVIEPSAFVVDAGPDVVTAPGQPVQLNGTASSPNGIIGYLWSPDMALSCTACQNTIASPDTTRFYVLMAMDGDSCTGYDSVLIHVMQKAAFIPTAFSPNADKLNDYFEFDILGAKSIEVNVYNRWGDRIYTNPAQHNGMLNNGDAWDGRKDGVLLPFDTYVYTLKVTYFARETEVISGTITMMQ